MPHFTFQSYSWSLGTTSFRMADFHRKVEEQLVLLNDFWNIPENNGVEWSRESGIQKKYYEYLSKNGFIYGKIDKDEDKEKTAREKTSGLVDIGLIDDTHRLTEVGEKLLAISKSGDFSSDNEFHIPCDSFLYLKQLIKTANKVQESYVRPYLVTGLVFESCDGYLTDEEFTYLLPLCVNADITNKVINYILSY
ncbi:MAG: AlwI family type II restriction endonuclease, partial [Ruminiclostridium sp.]|nr:AlwI family type II restriction endonuclease [Ruminiclostridium sp.]